jgi:hypothetical protein
MDSNQRGACDRCRGQKLRCVGLSGLMPTFESEGRLQRNEKPCDRCRKAQVECYSVRPASRKTASISSTGHGPQRQRRKSVTKLQQHNSYNSSSQNPSRTTNEVEYDELVGHEQHVFSSLPSAMDWSNQAQCELDWNSLDQWIPSLMEGQEKGFASQDPATTAGSASPPYTMRMIQEPSDYFGIRTEHDLSIADLGSLKSTHTPSETQQTSTPLNSDHAYNPSATSLQARQMCVQELTELNEALLRDKKVTNGRRQPAATSLSPTSHPATSDSRIGPSGGAWQYNIGRTLQHSHTFLHILQRLGPTKVSSADTRRSYSPSSHDDSNSSPRMLKEYNLEETRSSARSSHSPASFLPTPPLTLSSCTSRAAHSSAAPLDMPTLLSVICCYAYIVEAYSSIFSEILECIVRSPEKFEAIWIGLSLDGFSLDGHLTIQLECLLHITGRMLDKMEKILVGSSDLTLHGQDQGLLDNKLSAGLLDALYCYDDSAASGGDSRKELRIKQDMRNIQSALKCLD